jgi:hypothetical protein
MLGSDDFHTPISAIVCGHFRLRVGAKLGTFEFAASGIARPFPNHFPRGTPRVVGIRESAARDSQKKFKNWSHPAWAGRTRAGDAVITWSSFPC